MNERIRELWKQAHSRGAIVGIEEIDKFAELIIKECIQVATNAKSNEASAMLVVHFGIIE